jgi:predicted DsbA family dithiol-disulfide isomerase
MVDAAEHQSTTPVDVVVFADFVCPYSFIAQHEIDLLLEEYDVRLHWRPHWLHPEVPVEGMESPADPERRRATQAWLKEMSPEMTADMRFPEKRQFSFFAFEGLEIAQDLGMEVPYRRAIYDALWREGMDIGQVSTLEHAAVKAGMDPDALARGLSDRGYIDRTLHAIEAAREYGISTTPTMILGRTSILGWHYYEVIQTVLEQQGIFPKATIGAAIQES